MGAEAGLNAFAKRLVADIEATVLQLEAPGFARAVGRQQPLEHHGDVMSQQSRTVAALCLVPDALRGVVPQKLFRVGAQSKQMGYWPRDVIGHLLLIEQDLGKEAV